MTYKEKLLDPRWQKKRLIILERDNWSCIWCADTKTTLHVHHNYYESSDPWDTDDIYLQTLCSDCHFINHLKTTELEKVLIDSIQNSRIGDTEFIKIANKLITRMVNERKNG